MQPDVQRGFQEALEALDRSTDSMVELLLLARAARPPDRNTLTTSLDVVLKAASVVRDALSDMAKTAGAPVPEWNSREELTGAAEHLAVQVQERAANEWRLRLKEIATALAGGRVVSRRTRRVISSLDALRNAAAAELVRIAEGAVPPAFPGPRDGGWLDWAFGRPGEELETILAPLQRSAPDLCRFLLEVHPDDWQAVPPVPSSTHSASPGIVVPTSPAAPATPVPSTSAASPVQESASDSPAPAPEIFRAPASGQAASEPADGELHRPQPASAQPRQADHTAELPRDGPTGRAEAALGPPSAAPCPPPAQPASRPVLATKTVADEPLTSPAVASVHDMLVRCIAGEYLRAVLLAAGRAFAGLSDADPSFEAVLVAHHAATQAGTPPWPEWCYDPAGARQKAQTSPISARLTFLSAQCELARGEGAADPLPKQVGEALLEAFNDVSEVHQWLAAFRETVNVPGLWEQVCRPAPPDPTSEYGERRRAFAERYETGLLHRSDKAAYIRRQDRYLSRQPAFRLLNERLRQTGPAPLTPEERKLIESWLGKKPEAITDAWHESTERVSGKIKLHGSQRVELVRRAAEYLDLANRAWRAALALGSAPVAMKDVERRRRQLRDLLPAAGARAQGQPWGPLFRRLTRRLSS